jgi:uncharacterized protein YrrD
MSNTMFKDHTVIDREGGKVGTVTDVIYDNATSEPILLVVHGGLLGRSHFVPIGISNLTDEGTVELVVDKSVVNDSPRAGREHALSTADIDEIEQYYASRCA